MTATKRLIPWLLLFPTIVGAAWNSYQSFPPFRNNWIAATSSQTGLIFKQNFNDGVTTPQVGSATLTRSGSVVYASSNSALSEASSNQLAMNAYRYGGNR